MFEEYFWFLVRKKNLYKCGEIILIGFVIIIISVFKVVFWMMCWLRILSFMIENRRWDIKYGSINKCRYIMLNFC